MKNFTQNRHVECKRVNVAVYAKFSAKGGMIPLRIIWTDGRNIQIDRVMTVTRAPDLVGNVLPVRYSCIIGGAVRRLYFEPQKEQWFVEARI